jgi:hypothetical protein
VTAELSERSSEAIKATLTKIDPPPMGLDVAFITFAFNPERITLSHTAKVDGATGTSFDEQVKNLGFLEIGIDKLYLTGPKTASYCEALIDWSYPVPGAALKPGAQKSAKPVMLKLTWGTAGIDYTVSMRQVNITYLRFVGATGEPIRAEVSIKLYSRFKERKPGANPTSGGPPGRKAHTLDSSECLASLATSNYGRPGAWRGIASANGIDDPLRVQPGTQVYLPEPEDIGSGPGRLP